MNLINADANIAEKFEQNFQFYKKEVECPFDKNNILYSMWIAERDLLYSDKVYNERIKEYLLTIRKDELYVKVIRDNYLAFILSMMVGRFPFCVGQELVEYYAKEDYLNEHKEEMRRLSKLSETYIKR